MLYIEYHFRDNTDDIKSMRYLLNAPGRLNRWRRLVTCRSKLTVMSSGFFFYIIDTGLLHRAYMGGLHTVKCIHFPLFNYKKKWRHHSYICTIVSQCYICNIVCPRWVTCLDVHALKELKNSYESTKG